MVQRGWAKRCASFESSSALRSEVFHPKMQFIELSPAERFETPLNALLLIFFLAPFVRQGLRIPCIALSGSANISWDSLM